MACIDTNVSIEDMGCFACQIHDDYVCMYMQMVFVQVYV